MVATKHNKKAKYVKNCIERADGQYYLMYHKRLQCVRVTPKMFVDLPPA